MKFLRGWAAAFGLLAVVACHRAASVAADHACSEGQALQSARLRGGGLPPRTIALTFDDGPGARTLELSRYLKERGIRAGFFVTGKNIRAQHDGEAVLRALVDDGHVLGNHTTNHVSLTSLPPEAVVAELADTDALIAPFVPAGRFMFRPPYGAWNDAVLATLEVSPMRKYVGPVDWDLGFQWGHGAAADWDCWSKAGLSDPPVVDVATCGALYLEQIRHTSSGVVLMHDPYFINDDPRQGGTVDMVMNIVPVLEREGFSFVRIDEVPEVEKLLPPLPLSNEPRPEDASADATEPEAPPSASPQTSVTSDAPAGAPAATDQPVPATGGGRPDPCTASPQAGAR